MTVQTETLPTSPDQQAEFRPSQKAPDRDNPWEAFVTAIVLAICVYWVLIPIWPHLDSRILGDPETDAIRGMWGFDHIRRSLLPPQTPLWSDLVNFPAGAIFLTLPWTTGIFVAPLGALFGPFVAWNLSIAFMLWALGMSSAWMIKTLTKSWAAGLMLGSFITAQPLLLHSVGDGTAEHIALWTMPIFLGSAWKAIHEHSPKWALLAGVVAFFLAMDSPYHAIYSAVSAVFVLPWAFIRRWSPNQRIELFWSLGTLIVVSLLGALLLFVLYQAFPIKMASGADKVALLKMNAADARNWWQHDFTDVFVRDSSLAPTTIPSILIWISVVLITIGAPRSLPWFFAGVLMLILSMGLNGRLPIHLKQWLGGTGVFLGETILYLNNRLYAFPGIGQIRFPMRWLIPGSLMFFVGAGYGLANVYRHPRIRKVAFLISTIFALFGALNNLRSSRIDLGFPMQTLPKVEFAEWIQEQDGFGSVLLVPNKRPPPDSGKRSDLPVFANISPTLASSDNQYFQVIHGRPIYAKPNLKTLSSRSQNTEIARLVRNWDDMALPMLTANKPQPSKIPPSAYDPRSAEKRKAALEAFLTKGLRWIVLDKETYNDQAMEILRDQITRYIVQEKEFDDGTGVIIFEVALPD